MDLRLVEIFCRVYKDRSVSGAAKKLGLTQPTVSAHLKELEQAIGTPLFNRVGRQIEPTEAGRVLYGHAKSLPRLKHHVTAAMAQFLNRVEGDLLVGASSVPGEYLLPQLLAEFQRQHTAVRPRLRISDTSATLEGLRLGDLELGMVGSSSIGRGDLVFEPFAHDTLVLAVPVAPDWPIADSFSLHELRQLPFLVREPGSGTRTVFEAVLAARGLSLREFHVVAELDRTTAIKHAIQGGYGVSLLSRRAIASELAAGTLRATRVAELGSLSRTFYTVVSRRRVLSPVSRAFLEHIQTRRQLHSPDDPGKHTY